MLDVTPLLRVYAWHRRRQLSRDPIESQRLVLTQLIQRAGRTKFGRDHNFAAIKTVADFQSRVPVRDYEAFWETYWSQDFPTHRDLCWPGLNAFFALSSGTTKGTTKYIPCSAEMCRSNLRTGWDVLVHHVSNRPQSRVLGGVGLMLGGSTDLHTEAPGVQSGDLSGIAAVQVPPWLAARIYPPLELAHITDWEQKVQRIATEAPNLDVRTVSGTPSWMLILFEKLLEPIAGNNPAQSLSGLFANLELVVHGGVDFRPYRHRFETLLKGTRAELREVYAASEGFFAVADAAPTAGMRLSVDSGIFYEFIPLDELQSTSPARHWLQTVKTGIDYAIVVSTNAGLWSYLVGDTVRFLSLSPPRLLVSGRTSYMLSAFGEHLIGFEIERAVASAADELSLDVIDFCVGARFATRAGELGGHLFVVEFAQPAQSEILAAFQRDLDRALCAANDDYRAHRAKGFGLAMPAVRSVPHGTFAAWMKRRGKLGGQHKVPRVINDESLWADVCSYTKNLERSFEV